MLNPMCCMFLADPTGSVENSVWGLSVPRGTAALLQHHFYNRPQLQRPSFSTVLMSESSSPTPTIGGVCAASIPMRGPPNPERKYPPNAVVRIPYFG